MFYSLVTDLVDQYSFLNVFKYLTLEQDWQCLHLWW